MHLLSSTRAIQQLEHYQIVTEVNPFDVFDEIHQVVIDGISDNMASLVESGNYGAINATNTATNGFYVIMFTSQSYTLQDNTNIDRNIITDSKLVVKAQYFCSMQVYNSWYWNKHLQQHVITVTTLIIIHPRLEFNAIIYFHDITKSVCNRTKEEKSYQDILYVLLVLTMITY